MIIAAQNKNDEDRKSSSSGAIFPLIAKSILKQGGIVYGAAFNNDFGVEHIAVEDEKGLPKLYGSKYVFSDCKAYPDVKEKLKKGRTVLFSGTPCQVGGLKAYLKQDYDNLYTIDNICHGAPSQKVWKEYLNELTKGKDIQSVAFRDKTNGWRHYRFVVRYTDGTEYNVDHDSDLYMRGFIDNIILREACFHCKFKGIESRQSDITLGDLWGVWDFLPEMSDDKGTSLLFINSDKGRELIESVRTSIITSEIDEKQAIDRNVCAIRPSKPSMFRGRFIKEYKKTGELIPALRKYATPGFTLKAYRKVYNLTHKG
jgi:coenzyme F420-reducing hydrogenase beta subunit